MEQKNCTSCGLNFTIYDEDLKFYEKVSPQFNGQKCLLPSPTLCPDCRQQRRLSWRNERSLYKRTCDFTKKNIISMYSPDKPVKVYSNDIWWSDKWDPMEYGRDFDFFRPFFEQFAELQKEVPRIALFQKNAENSEYVNHCDDLKNCYLTVDTGFSEDVFYSKWIIKCRDLADTFQMEDAELCYETQYSVGNFNCIYTFLSDYSNDCVFLFSSDHCSNCIFSHNINHKKYYIFNKPASEQVYLEMRNNMKSYKKFEKYRSRFIDMLNTKAIHRANTFIRAEDCTGEYMYNCKNIKDSFDVIESQDCRYCYDAGHMKDCYDAYENAFNCELQYDCHACNRGVSTLFCHVSYDVNNMIYSDSCHNSSDLFGCIGLRHKKYCILNKQYTKEQYEELVPKIIEHMRRTGEWGEFFPVKLSPFAYNETVAMEYYPIIKEQALSKDFRWFDNDSKNCFPQTYQIPDNIDDVPDSISNEVLSCINCQNNYRIIAPELKLYKKIGVPIPRKCPDCRHLDRMALSTPRKLFDNNCKNCGKKIRTSFSPDRPDIVYCEDCYRQYTY